MPAIRAGREQIQDAGLGELAGQGARVGPDPRLLVRHRRPPRCSPAADRQRVLWFTMLAFGPRRGEALAMRWSLTDLDAATTSLRKQIRGPG
jgi:integrase